MNRTRTLARSEMSRFSLSFLLAFGMLLVLPEACQAEQSQPIAEQIAKTYGIDSFGQIEAIRYTWNRKSRGRNVSHKWEWRPKTDTVSYEGKDLKGNLVKVTYQRSQLDSQSEVVKKEIDPAFANDQYWLFLPFHVLWDGALATNEGKNKLPIGEGSADRVVVKYPSESGYQPGDTWDLYVGADKRIEEIAYHRSAAFPPHFSTAIYTGYKKAGPLLISTDHPGTLNGKPYRITLTDVSVKLTGSDKWLDAQ
jgi:hypothetical protein